jgi:hypothetical protein
MLKAALAISLVLAASSIANSHAFVQTEKITPYHTITQIPEIVHIPNEVTKSHNLGRYLVFGTPPISPDITLGPQNGPFSIAVMPENKATLFGTRGYTIMRDIPLDFHYTEMSQIRKFSGSEDSFVKYNYTGSGIKIAIVDTGVDFSNPDMQGTLARDEKNRPIMLDADGQGLVLTNATFIANINNLGMVENATKKFIEEKNRTLPKNATSTVYVTKDGVFLSMNKPKGIQISMYNSFYPAAGPKPIFNGTIVDDYKIGKSRSDYIRSASGVYKFGMIYQGATSGPFASVQVVPVLVVDSQTPGVYDTIIPDMSTSYKDYTRFDLKAGQKPKYDFDFTDETPIRLGSGNEHLTYDANKDGKPNYTAGTVGAYVLDVYGIISKNASHVDKILKATNGTVLPGLDPDGNFFGVMSDFVGHGTASAATIVSQGKNQYDIYNNTKKYTLTGVAPGAKIIPVKTLWLGDIMYSWMWASGFDNHNSTWNFSGRPRADIISNSWGISTFPSLKSAPGIDTLSLVSSALATPHSVDERFGGITIISSAGNAGHGYGTMGLPNASPHVITVGAATNNVFVGYGAFKGQPRFGNTTTSANEIVDFSSRGPSVIGDPKPDLVGTGAHGFVPSSVLNSRPSVKKEPFSMFGGTSMAAPVVAGAAAILMESLKEKNEEYTPFKIKNILMSTATDLSNDPYTQGAGYANSYKATQFVNGNGGVFAVYNDATYPNISKILQEPLKSQNYTLLGVSNIILSEKPQPQTGWFGGRLELGQKSATNFYVENPNPHPITVKIQPKSFHLISESKLDNTTKLNLTDAAYSKPGVYRPDYILLSEIKEHATLSSYFDAAKIPHDSNLMVISLNFAFPDFMNQTEKMYAADTKIASLYLYDWNDKNKDGKTSSDELSLVNRAGTWGTVQEMRVSEPASKFKNTPLVGVYAVPTRYSYWAGDTKMNSTSMDYTITVSHYKKQQWGEIWVDTNTLHIPPKSTSSFVATIIPQKDARPGQYQGFIEVSGANHTANAPVSFSIVTPIESATTAKILGQQGNILYGNGYVKGAFDMTNRYNAGDWRQYHFDVKNPQINVASIDVSWSDMHTNFSVFVIDPKGRIIQSNVPPGAFGHFMDWPTSDWLGPSPFSEGGGFFPVKNKDATSTVLFAPINQTGTYTVLLHNTLFGGTEKTEPFTVLAQFSSLSKDGTPPQIVMDVPFFVNGTLPEPQIIDESRTHTQYFVDDIQVPNLSLENMPDGKKNLRIIAEDAAGNKSEKIFSFVLDRTPPLIHFESPQNNTLVSGMITISYTINDENPGQHRMVMPDGSIHNATQLQINSDDLAEGENTILVQARDMAENTSSTILVLYVERTEPPNTIQTSDEMNNAVIMGVIGAAAIAAIAATIIIQKSKKKN